MKNTTISLMMLLFMAAVWLIDISVTTLNIGGILTNGLWQLSPTVAYHLGLYFIILIYFITICLYEFDRRKKE